MTFEELKYICERGVISRKCSLPALSFAFESGLYLGCPGKDVYYFIEEHAAELEPGTELRNKLVYLISKIIPAKPPSRTVQFTSCFRYMYGCFCKQGIFNRDNRNLLSAKGVYWKLHSSILDEVYTVFKDNNNYYGQVLFLEMSAHRLGDAACTTKDEPIFLECLSRYEEAHKLSCKHKFKKNAFSTLFWAMQYCHKYRMIDKCINYGFRFFGAVNDYCKNTTVGSKINDSLMLLRKYMPPKEYRMFLKQKYRKLKNPVFKKIKYLPYNNPFDL